MVTATTAFLTANAGTIALASAGLSTISAIRTNQAAEAQADANRQRALFQAQVARNNSVLAERQAEDAIARGEVEERQHRLRVRDLQARQQVEFAARGLDVNVGTPVEIAADTARTGELDALTIQANAEREALGFRTRSQQLLNEEQLFLSEAGAPFSPPASPLATALGGAFRFANLAGIAS